jgi:hypothetical protein
VGNALEQLITRRITEYTIVAYVKYAWPTASTTGYLVGIEQDIV